MLPIAVQRDIRSSVSKFGYCIVPGNDFVLSSEMRSAFNFFKTDWDNLVLDAYLMDGGRYRYRRYGRYFFQPAAAELLPLPGSTYYQSKEVNIFAGGIDRVFAPLLPDTYQNAFLLELIRVDFAQFPVPDAIFSGPWEIGIHQIRVVATPDEAGKVTPEGIHHDGLEFASIHLIGRKNVSGGVNTVYNNNQQPLETVTLADPLDSIYLEDPRVMHGNLLLYPQDKTQLGTRDVLLIDINYSPQLTKANGL